MKIKRYARAEVVDIYELEVDETLVNEINESIKKHKPDFVNLTLEDLIVFIKDEVHPREKEEIPCFYGKEFLIEYVHCYINDKIWENYCGIEDSETYDWDDEYVED